MRRAVPVVLLALVGCGAPAREPAAEAPARIVPAPTAPKRPKLSIEIPSASPGMGGPTRVNVAPIAVDLAALPRMTVAPLESNAGFSFYEQKVTPKCDPGTVAQAYPGWGVRPALPARSVLDVEGVRVAPAALDGTYDDLGGALTRGSAPRGAATWVSLALVASSDAIDVARYEASFTHTGWRAVATRKETVRPAEIVPRAVYAYRRCAAKCDRPLDDPARAEVVGLIGPRAVWTSASELTAVRPRSDSFTLAELTLVPGAATSFTIVYERLDVDELHDPSLTVEQARPRPARRPWQEPRSLDAIEAASIDIVWADEPEMTVYTGLTFAHADQLEPVGPVTFDEPHCVDFQ